MSAILGEIVSGLSINLASSLAWDKIIQRDNKKAIEQIRLHIGEFNRKYDNTEVDTNAFEKFLRSSDIVDEIYTRIFKSYKVDIEPIIDFKIHMGKYAVDEVNKYYEQYSRHIKNEDVFYEYFFDLIDSLINIRNDLLAFGSSVQTSILAEQIDMAKQDIKSEIKTQFAQMKEDNIFAEDKINKIKELVNLYRFSEAIKQISEVLESQQLLSNSQRELVYYQRARILINTRLYSELDNILEKIRRINPDSKYITEINYYIACHKQDRKLFGETIKKFENHKYSLEQIVLKRANFELSLDNIDKVLELIASKSKINEELQEHAEVHFYYGISLIRSSDFKQAYIEFNKAFQLGNNIIYKYNSLISRFFILYNDIERRSASSKEYLDEVRNIIIEFREIKYIVECLSDEEVSYYWRYLIGLELIVDPKRALDEIDEIDKSLEGCKLIKGIKAEVYFMNSMDNEAKRLFEDIWKYDPLYTNNLFFIYAKEGNWNAILSKYQQLLETVFTENPIILTIYNKARCEIEGYESIRNDIRRLLEIHSSEIMFINGVINIVLENKDEETFTLILAILNSKKDTMNDAELNLIGRTLNEFSKFEDSRNLVESRIENSEVLLNVYIKTFGRLDEASDTLKIAYEKVKILYNNGCRYKSLLRFKANVELILEIPRKSIQTLEEYRDIYGIDDYYAYYYIASKMNKNEYDGLDKEVEFLLSTNNASFHQIVAVLKAKQGAWDEAQRIALSALYYSYDNLGKEILFNYISMCFSNIDKEQNKKELEEVVNNSVVTIKSKDKLRNIAIHSEKNIITEPGEVKFGCENYHSDDRTSLILTTLGRKGEIVVLDNEEYEILDIVDLFTYYNRYCLSKLETDYPKHNFFITYSSPSSEGVIEEMKKTMESTNEDKHIQLDMYNFGVEYGLPISYLSGKNTNNYSEMIISLLNHKNQHLYVGEVSVYEGAEYVISLSSIIILATFNMLDKLEHISDKCVITKEVENSIIEGIKESQKHAKISSGVAMVNEDGQLSYYSYTEDDKKKRKIYWTKILQTISKIKCIKVDIDENDIYDKLAKILLDEDISSIEVSKKSNRVLVCDDLFIRRLHHGVTGIEGTTNIIGVLISEGLLTFEELIDLTLNLVKCKYLYPINASLIYECFVWILSIQDEEIRNLYFDKLKSIYKNLLDDVSTPYYREIHEEFVRIVQKSEIPIAFVYELVREPFKLKPLNEFLREKSQEIVRRMFSNEGT
ncbi:PIN domain-containing protein [Clostridium aciditolerans]|uniref:PIN domain-containing protein n=1 Tax=Clostridium aciditolerans TaxID=339861 RepID=A0A934M1L7_9CLOT|nr:hypothetical protein [Clostridium aciditolerans]MBI6873434.1 hypothetical protein [Clostridium aciditolerans]